MKKTIFFLVVVFTVILAVACVAENNTSSPDESTPVHNESSALPEMSEEDSVPEASGEVSEEVSEEVSDEVSDEVIPPNTGTAVFDINVTTSGSFDDEASEIEGYVNFIDHGNIGQNWKIEITVSDNIKSFSFIELDSSIALRVGETLYFHRAWKYDEPLMLHTYINDVFYNRGLSYITGDGEVVYYGFSCNMNTGDVGYGEVGLLLGQIPVGTYEPEVTGTSYQWENDIFKTYFDTYVRDDHRIAWSHIGVSEGKYVSPDKNGYTKFDIYCVKRSYDQFCEYYAVPYGETQIETVYIFQFDDSMVPVWIKPAN